MKRSAQTKGMVFPWLGKEFLKPASADMNGGRISGGGGPRGFTSASTGSRVTRIDPPPTLRTSAFPTRSYFSGRSIPVKAWSPRFREVLFSVRAFSSSCAVFAGEGAIFALRAEFLRSVRGFYRRGGGFCGSCGVFVIRAGFLRSGGRFLPSVRGFWRLGWWGRSGGIFNRNGSDSGHGRTA